MMKSDERRSCVVKFQLGSEEDSGSRGIMNRISIVKLEEILVSEGYY